MSVATSSATANYARRCFVVDPVCAIEFGHSLNSLLYFSELARSYWPHVEAFSSMHLPTAADERYSKFFDFYYDRFIPIVRQRCDTFGQEAEGHHQPFAQALRDFGNFMFAKQVRASDSLLLHNADLYSSLALLTLIDAAEPVRVPNIYLRYIGVMENASCADYSFETLVARLRAMLAQGMRISVSAETPVLARRLSTLLDAPVHTTPYPLLKGEVFDLPEGPFTVLCGGSARLDKGFARLAPIIAKVDKEADADIRFIVQNLPPRDQASHADPIAQLYCRPSVDLLNGILTQPQVVDSFKRASIAIMPYDALTYAERGSAILMESIMHGRLCVGQDGTAFAEQIRRYNAGEIADSDEQFAAAIIALSRIPKPYLVEQADLCRRRYLSDVNSAYDRWLEDLI